MFIRKVKPIAIEVQIEKIYDLIASLKIFNLFANPKSKAEMLANNNTSAHWEACQKAIKKLSFIDANNIIEALQFWEKQKQTIFPSRLHLKTILQIPNRAMEIMLKIQWIYSSCDGVSDNAEQVTLPSKIRELHTVLFANAAKPSKEALAVAPLTSANLSSHRITGAR